MRPASMSPAEYYLGRLPRASKYNAKRVNGAQSGRPDKLNFDSQAEEQRYEMLRLMEKAGEISNLSRQVRFRIEVNGLHVCDYVADFVYQRGAETVVEDVKGVRTRDYLLKKKLMLAVHGVAIEETGRRRERRRPKSRSTTRGRR